MAKFIKLENKIINIEAIECVCENRVITKHREEWFNSDETEVKGIVIFMTDPNNGIAFESISLDDFMELVK